MALGSVKVPAGMEPLFQTAEELVSRFFRDRKDDPGHGTIEIFGERYILVRAASLSVEFFSMVYDLHGPGREAEADAFARNLLFDLAHAIGRADAQNFHSRMGLVDPIARLSAGPIHFAYAGWAFVDILPESSPTPDQEFCLVYDHPYSFESDAWQRAGRPRAFPACIMNAGYSSGWCEESFGVELVASEILCRARGDDCCRFVMAHPGRIEAFVARYVARRPELAARIGAHEVPDFFSRKRAEEELRRSHAELERRVEERTAELRASEQQLRQAQKLEAVGRLAGGIAHDFNNLMSVIMVRCGLLARRLDADDPVRRELDEILEATDRASTLTQQLLTFSRARVLRREPVDVAAVTAALAQSLLPLVGAHIEVTVARGDGAAVVEADRGEIEQVLVNLVVNARDAMPRGGHLAIATGRVDVAASQVTTTGVLAPGAYVTIAVTDDGTGMDAATVANIFDPFFTTKPNGKGTGLGLATVCGVVQGLGGEIDVASTSGAGTRFVLYLPASGAAAAPVVPVVDGDLPGGDETILLVEDRDDLRGTLVEVLRACGYTVLAAAGADEALALLDAHAAEVALLVTDVVMPGMGGPELAAQVGVRHPGLPVLYLSGYAPDEALRRAAEARTVAFLQKPFRPDELARQVRALLA
ncbi:MAG: response regulator, partial [Myxococcales bacterium]|nr:response regulator [Myxococcales bacterium]